MCGIAGFQGTFAPELLSRMADAIAHRGPDDFGTWYTREGEAGLAHRRLSIIDLSPLGHQPMMDAVGTAVIVFNGEIYNFRELRSGLVDKGYTFRSQSDTEVLLALYRDRREEMLLALNGIFAFAIYDHSDRSLLLACDAMGVKPLYFTEDCDGFAFASELKGLLECTRVAPSLNVSALFRYLGLLWSPGGATPFEGILRLGPGEALRIRNARIERKWRWSPSRWAGAPSKIEAADAIKKVHEGVRDAVHRQMVSDVPVGAFLSGGLDSSAVVAAAREFAPDIECFTIDTSHDQDAGMTDDLPYARLVARHLGVKLHEIQVDSARMAADVEQMVFQLDEPLADPAPLNVLYISQLARRHGVKVLLSGAGGDDLFSGYRRHRALMLERYWAWLPLAARQRLREAASLMNKRGGWGRRLARAFAQADSPPDQRLTGYFLWADPGRVLNLFAPEHRAALSNDRMSAPMEEHLRTLPDMLPRLHRMLALEQRFFLADHNLLYTDKMSMAAGVEVRVPLLDNKLVELVNPLLPTLKQRGLEGKWILKKALEPYLPREVIYRPKTGFGAPLRRWLRHELKEWVDDLLSAETLRRRGLFDPRAVAAFVADDRAGKVDGAYTILGLACIEIWCRQFLDRRMRGRVEVG